MLFGQEGFVWNLGCGKGRDFYQANLNYSSHLTLRWRYLYTTYLMEKIEELSYEKIVKVRV
jgi:hypothetical protein